MRRFVIFVMSVLVMIGTIFIIHSLTRPKLPQFELQRVLTLDQGKVDIKLTLDGKSAALADPNGKLEVWVIDEAQQSVEEIANKQINPSFRDIPIAINPKGMTLAYVDDNDSCPIKIWDIERNVTDSLCPAQNERATALTFSPDGKILAASIGMHTPLSHTNFDLPKIYVWDAVTLQPMTTSFSGISMWTTALAISPDNHWIVAGGCHTFDAEARCNQGEIFIWNLSTGKVVKGPVYQHGSEVSAFAFQPDSSRFVSGNGGGDRFYGSPNDYTIALWNITPEIQQSISWDNGEVFSLAFSPDAKLLAIGTGDNKISSDSSVRVWDFTNDPVVLDNNKTPVKSIAFTPDGGRLLVAGNDGTIRVWVIKSTS